MTELTNPSYIKPLLERHGFAFSKSLGQNFLINSAIPPKIAEGAGISAEDTVLEIGPGIGCLTRELSRLAKRVVSVEIDRKLIPVLEETVGDLENVDVINDDIMKVDINALCEKYGGESFVVCANLPYYITTQIIMKLLEGAPVKRITVMVQKELAQRFCSKPGTPEYGAVTAAASFYSEAKILFHVSPGSFLPAPKVSSSVVRFDRIPPPVSVRDERMFFRVIKAAFAMRRKTFANNLSAEFGISKTEATEILTSLGYSASVRGETFSVSGYAAVSNALPSAES